LTAARAFVSVLVLALLAGCGSDAERANAPAPSASPDAADSPDAAVDGPRMDDGAFWRLIADTRAAGGNETDGQSDLLEQRLRHLPPKQIAQFERICQRLDRQAYTYELWGAAYVIEDGCSDDCFRDFRAI
jgi:hypothetical protein